MELFLKTKHWQLFILLIGVPLFMQIFMLVTNNIDLMFAMTPVLTVLYIFTFFGWFWAIGTRLNSKLPASVKLNLKLFKTSLVIPIVYILVISIYIGFVALGQIESDKNPMFLMNDIIKVVFPLHIFSMVCIIYAMWFVAKTIKSIESQKPVKFSDFSGDFILLWLYPIGI